MFKFLDQCFARVRFWKSVSSKTAVQGQPLGFDTKYLALTDRNMQVRFSLKVVWES